MLSARRRCVQLPVDLGERSTQYNDGQTDKDEFAPGIPDLLTARIRRRFTVRAQLTEAAMKYIALVALLIIASGSTAGAQGPLCVALRVETPPDAKHEFSTLEGKATATVAWRTGERFNQFYIDLTVRDPDAGLIHVSVRGDRTPGSPVLDEFDIHVGDSRRTSTGPSFGLAALRIHGSVRRGIRNACE